MLKYFSDSLKNKFFMKDYFTVFSLLTLLVNGACGAKKAPFYIKAISSEELKIHAFETCGRNFRVLKFENDTALIECLMKD